ALTRRDSLTDAERQKVLTGVARFTGLDQRALDRTALGISMPQFAERLLADARKVVGRYDSRLTGPLEASGEPYDPTRDPSLRNIIDDVAVVRYFRSELHFESDLPYQGPFGGGYPPPAAFRGDWMSVRWNQPAPSGGGRAASTSTDQPL